ncbi:MAG: hypothetical protein RLZZ230_251, partial [Candidatus Parcubacteria bacterium]
SYILKCDKLRLTLHADYLLICVVALETGDTAMVVSLI